jgi:hypothetical protein
VKRLKERAVNGAGVDRLRVLRLPTSLLPKRVG